MDSVRPLHVGRFLFSYFSSFTPWLGSVRQWHWISSALCLVGMLLFAITGITLNHAGQIKSEIRIRTVELSVPKVVMAPALAYTAIEGFAAEASIPRELRDWLKEEVGISVGSQFAEWGEYEIYLSMPRPGGDSWLSIDLETGELLYEDTSRGVVSYINDLHKGRNTGITWAWFLDIFSTACIIFCITGLILLQRHSQSRPLTWPVVGLGFVVPALIAILFIHS